MNVLGSPEHLHYHRFVQPASRRLWAAERPSVLRRSRQMETIRFGRWALEVDRELTRSLYAAIPEGGAAECGCNDCSRFQAARRSLHPPVVLSLLERLGIDPSKEVEVVNYGTPESGDIWNWWSLFIGRIASGPDAASEDGKLGLEAVSGGFRIGFTEQISIPMEGFRDRPGQVQVECFHSAPP